MGSLPNGTQIEDNTHHDHHARIAQIPWLLDYYDIPLNSLLYSIINDLIVHNQELCNVTARLQLSFEGINKNHTHLQQCYDDKLRDFNILYGYHSSYKSELEQVHLKLRETEALLALQTTITATQESREVPPPPGLGFDSPQNSISQVHSQGSHEHRSASITSNHRSPPATRSCPTLHLPGQRKINWLTNRLIEIEAEKTRLVQIIESQRRVVDKVWEEMACAPGLELALRQAQRLQGRCGRCGEALEGHSSHQGDQGRE